MTSTTGRSAATSLLDRSASLRGAVRALDHRRGGRDDVRILCYHGLSQTPLEVEDACFTTAARFGAQMRYLAEHFDVLHLEDAFDPQRERRRPVACITFDDGFAGVYDHAYPTLEELGLPAATFLVTDLIDTDTTVWFGQLHQAIIESTSTSVSHAGTDHDLTGPSERARASSTLQLELKALPAPEFGPAFAAVMAQLGTSVPEPNDAYRMLTSAQVREMASVDIMRFGGHSATHQILTRTDPAHAAEEITRSVRAVSMLVERPSRAFAYPNGQPDDFDDDCIDQLSALGIELALTTVPGPNRVGDDPYRLRRIVVNADEGPGLFAARVHHVGRHLRELVSRPWSRNPDRPTPLPAEDG